MKTRQKQSRKKGKIRKEQLPGLPPTTEQLLSFDAYFTILLSEHRALPHHKAPLKLYMKKLGLKHSTKSNFDIAFETY